jgi:hypothetical protein
MVVFAPRRAMSSITVILLVAVILALAVAAGAFIQRQGTFRLRGTFGPEEREKRVAKFRIRSLQPAEASRFAEDWRVVQEHFVDDPRSAVSQADWLINEALKARGYPMGEFEQQAADLSVQYPAVAINYRVAHQIAMDDRKRSASTEDLRKAMQYFRSLFEEVLDLRGTRMEEVHPT